jgi:hypothetical protein
VQRVKGLSADRAQHAEPPGPNESDPAVRQTTSNLNISIRFVVVKLFCSLSALSVWQGKKRVFLKKEAETFAKWLRRWAI